MRTPVEVLQIYIELYRASLNRNRPMVATRFLVLSLSASLHLQLELIADFCRLRIRELNLHHLACKLDRDELSDAEEFHSLVSQLKRRYPLERAEQLLRQLNIELSEPSAAFESNEEFVANAFGMTLEELKTQVNNG